MATVDHEARAHSFVSSHRATGRWPLQGTPERQRLQKLRAARRTNTPRRNMASGWAVLDAYDPTWADNALIVDWVPRAHSFVAGHRETGRWPLAATPEGAHLQKLRTARRTNTPTGNMPDAWGVLDAYDPTWADNQLLVDHVARAHSFVSSHRTTGRWPLAGTPEGRHLQKLWVARNANKPHGNMVDAWAVLDAYDPAWADHKKAVDHEARARDLVKGHRTTGRWPLQGTLEAVRLQTLRTARRTNTPTGNMASGWAVLDSYDPTWADSTHLTAERSAGANSVVGRAAEATGVCS